MSKIKIDRADRFFSLYVRERDDWRCKRCGNTGESLQCSHYFGRANEAVRFEPLNADTLCYACHVMWGSTDREGYRNFKLNQLGDNMFKVLILRANGYKKKDRKMDAIKWRLAYQDLCKQKNIKPRV